VRRFATGGGDVFTARETPFGSAESVTAGAAATGAVTRFGPSSFVNSMRPSTRIAVPYERCHTLEWRMALADAIDIAGGAAVGVDRNRPVGDQAAVCNEVATGVDRGQ
jgi:hypothetical protein